MKRDKGLDLFFKVADFISKGYIILLIVCSTFIVIFDKPDYLSLTREGWTCLIGALILIFTKRNYDKLVK